MNFPKLFRSSTIYIVAIVLTAFFFQNCTSKGYIQKATSIDLPFWTETIETRDNCEFAVHGKFEIPMSSVHPFIDEYLLQPIDLKNVRFDPYLLQSENRPSIMKDGELFLLRDCKGKNTWDVLLNAKTGELWIMVGYPDMAGDASPCDK